MNENNNPNLFEIAAREKFRFPSKRGEITTEQLFELPLQSKDGFSLDGVAQAVNAELQKASTESFVDTSNPNRVPLQQKLDLVKHVIAVRMQERDAVRVRKEKAEKRAKLLEVLENKQDEQLRSKGIEELQRELALLD